MNVPPASHVLDFEERNRFCLVEAFECAIDALASVDQIRGDIVAWGQDMHRTPSRVGDGDSYQQREVARRRPG